MELIIIASLTALGYFFGRIAERKHFESIRLREALYKDILVFNERHLPVGAWRSGPLVGGFEGCGGRMPAMCAPISPKPTPPASRARSVLGR